MRNRVAIVTGGGGFIGLNLVETLSASRSYESVYIFDKQTHGYNQSGVDYVLKNGNVALIKGDVVGVDFETTLNNMPPADIFHLAAESHVDRSISGPESFFYTNILGTFHVCEATRKRRDFGITDNLVVVSTDEVYGDEGVFPTTLGSPIKPSSPYSASKAGGDLIVQSYRRTYNLPIKLVRCCNNFGKWQNREKFIPTILHSIKRDQPIPVYGTGLNWRQWVPVQEHARRLFEFVSSNNLDMHVGGFSVTNLGLIETIEKIVDKPLNKSFIADRPGHDVKYELHDEMAIDQELFVAHLETYVQEELNGTET